MLSSFYPRCCVCSTTATLRISGALASCSSGSRCHPRWCSTGSRDTLTTKRYVELSVMYLLFGIHQDDSVTVSCYEDLWYTWWVTACHPMKGGTFSFGSYQTIHFWIFSDAIICSTIVNLNCLISMLYHNFIRFCYSGVDRAIFWIV